MKYKEQESHEIDMEGFEPVEKIIHNRGKLSVSFYSEHHKITLTTSLRERLRVKTSDRANIFFNTKKKSVAIQFAEEGAYSINKGACISCKNLFDMMKSQSINFDRKTFLSGEFNIDVVNRIIECPFK